MEGFDFKVGDDEDKTNVGVSGVLYGVGVPHLSRHSVVLNATGKLMEEEEYKNIEFLSEVLPCGLEAYGVFHFNDKPGIPEKLEQLVAQLPEQLLAVRDPLVFLRGENGALRGYLQHEGQFVEYPIKTLPSQHLMNHITTVRIRGKMTLECIQNPAEISNAFQHLIEKVRKGLTP